MKAILIDSVISTSVIGMEAEIVNWNGKEEYQLKPLQIQLDETWQECTKKLH